ncbi:hypothetical protein R1sor_026996 [Riccia sorocarpa]|uniref:Reverse transcriptase domain-containing protein n=1 Tax=Riccia sorocarpa TaxID=122646 RepID=A0ABD3GDN5_9MARC
MREERCRNIRIVGLAEAEGEVTKDLVLKFFKDDLRVAEPAVEYVSRVGRSDKGDRPILVRFKSVEGRGRILGYWNVRGLSDSVVLGGINLWKELDIFALAETWECSDEASVEILGFVRIVAVWNKKRFQRGRGFGGLAIWSRNRLGVKITVAHVDARKQFICLQLQEGRSKGFLVFTYFAPLGSPAYVALEEGADPLFELTRKVCRWSEEGPVWLAGDFNSRSMSMHGVAVQELGSQLWKRAGSDEVLERVSEDEGRNNLTNFFMQFVNSCGLTILNGSRKTLKSVCPVREDRRLYESEMERQVGSGELSSEEITSLMLSTARKVFGKPRSRGKSWFDDHCVEARRKAISASDPERVAAHKSYRNLVRMKKLRFLAERQLVLANELMQNPASFWRRLRPHRVEAALVDADLQQYVRQLYYFPETMGMAYSPRTWCSFSKPEVEKVLGSLCTGKAADILGLTAELLKWGGAGLIRVITQKMNKARKEGFPVEWNDRRVVPVYKTGPREEPASYRTIMIAHIFAKVFGKLLEMRLTDWCEEQGVRAPVQAGFRRQFSTLDHLLTLRVIMEEAKRARQPLLILFVDFKKAFDSVARNLIQDQLITLNVPGDLINAIARLYQSVIVKTQQQDTGVDSTLGVIQGCPLSPTLFGPFIEKLFWLSSGEAGVSVGSQRVSMLIFADDIALVGSDEGQMKQHIANLETFCLTTGMQVNLGKTKWLGWGHKAEEAFLFQGQQITECKSYKYLGLEMSSNLSWASGVQSRVDGGRRALFALWGKCDRTGLVAWSLRKHLFDSVVQSAVPYAAPIWGPSASKTSWKKLEVIQKMFLQHELGVKVQTPYSLLLAETGRWPLEVEALFRSIQYARCLQKQEPTRISSQAKLVSMGRGWFANLCSWAARWGFPEERWGEDSSMRERLSVAVVSKLWSLPSPRQQYYLRDICRLQPYTEQSYLRAALSVKERQLVARYRTSSHHLRVEEGRWLGISREDRLCTLCSLGKIENEHHALLVCPRYQSLRVEHGIPCFTDLRDFFSLPPVQISKYIYKVDSCRKEMMQSHLDVVGTRSQ